MNPVIFQIIDWIQYHEVDETEVIDYKKNKKYHHDKQGSKESCFLCAYKTTKQKNTTS